MEAVPLDACSELTVDVSNRIGFVIRSPEGNCSFSSQAYRVTILLISYLQLSEANATAVVIVNSYKSGEEDSLFSLSDSSCALYDVQYNTVELQYRLPFQ